jgi:hypothetical protein
MNTIEEVLSKYTVIFEINFLTKVFDYVLAKAESL